MFQIQLLDLEQEKVHQRIAETQQKKFADLKALNKEEMMGNISENVSTLYIY